MRWATFSIPVCQNVQISVRTLVHIEHGEGNQTLKSLNAVFRPFGMQMGVVRIRRNH
ncbi:DNA-binding protein [Pseudomonas poae RE*1-1-14]|nr:DNA-binding protein [Pseudomonas poae RE*1-1-14]